MAGELNGTDVLIAKAGTDLTGQMEATITYGGTPIDISNKSYGDWVTLLDGELSAQQIVIAGTLVYNSAADCEAVRADAFVGAQDEYTVAFAATGETLTGQFVPTGMSDTLPHGDKVSTAISFNSSGEVARTPPTV